MNVIKGEYQILFKHPKCPKEMNEFEVFRGKCENFAPNGNCVFINEDNKMLIVRYRDIIQMKPIKEK